MLRILGWHEFEARAARTFFCQELLFCRILSDAFDRQNNLEKKNYHVCSKFYFILSIQPRLERPKLLRWTSHTHLKLTN
jgi:hypothetical protein